MHRGTAFRKPWIIAAGLAAAAIAAMGLLDVRVARLWMNSAGLAAGACGIAIPLGILTAIIIVKTNAPGRGLAAIVFSGMLFIPLFLAAGAWDAGFGVQGWHTLVTNPHLAQQPILAGWRAAIWIHGLAAVPWVTLIVGVGLLSVEREIEEDALLMMPPLRVLWRVTLPRVLPAVIVALLWVSIVASVEISVTDFFQVRTFAEEVYTQAALGESVFGGARSLSASAAAWWLGLSISALLAVAAILVAREALRNFGNVSLRNPWRWQLAKGRWPAAALLVTIALLVAGVPLANLLFKVGGTVVQTAEGRVRGWSAAHAIARVAGAPREFADDLWLSTWIGAAAATGSVLIGSALAWSMRLSRRTPLIRILALAICFTIPGPVLGIAAIRLLNQPPGSPLAFFAPLYDSQFPTWLVQTIRALPLATLILWAAFASIPDAILESATLDGVSGWRKLAYVGLPIRWPAVGIAWLVAFALATGELSATVLVLPPGRATAISVRVFQLLHYGVEEGVAAIAIVMGTSACLITMLAAGLAWRLRR
jgi:iron(III) transport system permease protein